MQGVQDRRGISFHALLYEQLLQSLSEHYYDVMHPGVQSCEHFFMRFCCANAGGLHSAPSTASSLSRKNSGGAGSAYDARHGDAVWDGKVMTLEPHSHMPANRVSERAFLRQQATGTPQPLFLGIVPGATRAYNHEDQTGHVCTSSQQPQEPD